VRQVVERELGNALVEHAIVIQKGIKRYLFRKHMKLVLSCRTVARYFKMIRRQKQLAKTYTEKYIKSKQIIVKSMRGYIKRK